MQQWEYLIFYAYLEGQNYFVPMSDGPLELEKFLTRCGTNRWELISVIPVVHSPDDNNPLMARSAASTQLMGVLKRSKTRT
jgi:hypothetical protein